MRTTLSTIAALAATFQFASAGFSDASAFSCPSNTNNQCNSQQSSGFDWTSLNLGSFSSYGDFDFSGWTCASSFGGSSKRDTLTSRAFQNKCITGSAHTDVSSCPSFGAGSSSDVSAFSVTEFQVSVEFDCDLEFHYNMPGGTTCKQKSSCQTGGTTISNTQCGGAKNVTIVYPSQSSGSGKGKSSCSIGVHSMSFDCSTASSTVYHSYTKTTPSSTLETIASTSSSLAIKSTLSSSVGSASSFFSSASSTIVLSSSVETTQAVSSPVSKTKTSQLLSSPVSSIESVASTTSSAVGIESTSSLIVSSAESSLAVSSPVSKTKTSQLLSSPVSSIESVASTTSSAVGIESTSSLSVSSAESSPAISSPVVSSTSPAESEVITTIIIETSTTICPVTLTHVIGGSTSLETSTTIHTSAGSTSTEIGTISHVTGGTTSLETSVSTSTVEITTTKTVCTKCEARSTTSAQGIVSTPAISATSSSSGPVTTAPCPDVLPSCLNTWLFSEGCSSNTDSDCYCPSSTFVSNVFACLSAYGASDDEISAAQTYFQGICAAHVSGNPAIITAASTLTITASAAIKSVPVTTVQVFTTLVVPCTETTGISAGSIIPSSSTTLVLSTAITVPQVIFTTVSGSRTASADLVAGTAPASVGAGTTISIPASSTLAVLASGTSLASNGTVKASATPTQQTTSGVGKVGFTFGSIVLAFVGVLAL